MRNTIERFLQLLGHGSAGGITEVSIAPESYRAKVGYFDNIEKAVEAITKYDGKEIVYVSLNPVKRALLARANNRLIDAKNRTTDGETLCDSWFFGDVDPKRPKGVSSTQDELNAAIEVGKQLYDFLRNAGVPRDSVITAVSGNGVYILIRLPDYELTPERIEIKKRLLNFLADHFSDDKVEVDRKVFNPSRLIGALGTVKCKGDSIEERPHRRSEIRTVAGAKFDPSLPQEVKPYDLYALVEKFLPLPAEKEQRSTFTPQNNGYFDIRSFSHLLEGYHETSRGWAYARCPHHKGSGNSSFFIRSETGAYGCFAGCTPAQIREALGVPKPDITNAKTSDRSSSSHSTRTKENNEIESEPSERPVIVTCLADVQPEEVDWLWLPYIPKGKLTLIEGDPGVGKSSLTLALATAVAAGSGLPGSEPTTPQNVLILNAEDGLPDTVRPRLDSMQANVSRIFAIDVPVVFDDAGLLQIEAAIIKYKPALVIVDPLVAYLGSDVDLHRANETRLVMARLAQIAERHRCAIVAIRHLTKSGKDKAIYRGIGSIDLTAACRSVLLVGCDPNDPAKRAVVQIKNNLAQLGGPIGYEIVDGRFYWKPGSDLTAAKILAAASSDTAEEQTALTEAIDFLRSGLSDGSQPSEDVKKDARNAGISERTLFRAKASLGIKARKQGQPGKTGQRWFWFLSETNAEACQTTAEECQGKTFGSLRGNADSKGFSSDNLAEGCQDSVFGSLRGEVGSLRETEDREVFEP